MFDSNRGQPFLLSHQHSGVSVMVDPGQHGPQLLRLIDGQRSFAEIFDRYRAGWRGSDAAPDNASLFADFAASFEVLNSLERLLLRHPEAGPARP